MDDRTTKILDWASDYIEVCETCGNVTPLPYGSYLLSEDLFGYMCDKCLEEVTVDELR